MTPYRNRRSLEGEDSKPRQPYLLAGALVLAVIVIVGLAVYNLERASERSAGAPPDGRSNAAESIPVGAPTVPSFDVVRISRGGTGVLAGRAAPDSLVEVMVDGEVVGDVRADRNGEWVMILEQPLDPGTIEMTLLATLDGREPVESDDVVVVSIPEPLLPERFDEPKGEGVIAVLSPKDGEGASRVMQKPGLAAPGEVGDSLTVDTVDYGADGRTVFSGRALPRITVRVYLDNRFVGEVRVSDDGLWQVVADSPIEPGEHRLRVDQVVDDGEVQLRVTQPFEAGAELDRALAENRVVVRPGNTLWAIARKLYGRGIRYTLIFQENSEQIVDPDLIYPGQIFAVPTLSEDTRTYPSDEG